MARRDDDPTIPIEQLRGHAGWARGRERGKIPTPLRPADPGSRVARLDSIERLPSGKAGARIAAEAIILLPPRRQGVVEFPSVLPETHELIMPWRPEGRPSGEAGLACEPTSRTSRVRVGMAIEATIPR